MIMTSKQICFLICIALLFCTSCSKEVNYRGYVPVTQEEAELFAKELETVANQGDMSLILNSNTDLNAVGAIYTFRGMDIPAHIKKASNKTQAQFSDMMKGQNAEMFKNTTSIQYVSCHFKDNVARIVFKMDKYNFGDIVYTNSICTFQLVKHKSDNRIFLAVYGFKDPANK